MDAIQRSHFMNAIYVVQLLGGRDQKTGAMLYQDTLLAAGKLSRALTIRLIELQSNAELLPALRRIAKECAREGLSPVLHLETHGTETGLGLSSGMEVPWSDLKSSLTPINTCSRVNLLVTMATCHGANLVRTVVATDPAPMWGLVGPTEQVLESDVRAGFAAFYATLAGTLNLNAALEALRAAPISLPESWVVYSSELIFALAYGHYLATHANPAGQRAAERRVLKAWRRRNPKGARRPPGLRRAVRRQVAEKLNFFEKFKTRFFMLDRYPDNAERFPISISDCERLYEIHRTGIPISAA